ncbi:MAG: hypothetical protein QOJ63_1366 [Solirubrobacteraceae bacterium]|nr:hypothetical protein [Solirubrobacteraceae bacterium]
MALLLRDRDATSDLAAEPPGDGGATTVADFACQTCGASMKSGQDWCLECGAAAPGRLGTRPGWRAAFTVVALTLLLVVGAVVASYAALTTDAERKAAAPSSGSGAPIAAQPPAVAPAPVAVAPIVPGATGPGTVPPAVAPAPGAVTPIIPTKPPAPATNTPVAPPTVAQAPPATVKPSPAPANAKPAAPPAPKPEIIRLKDDAASTYDPAKRAGAEFGPAANAVDKSPKSVWDVSVPADGKPIGAGLMIDLGKPYALRALRLATPTPGFHVEVYGAVSAKETPEDILDKRWEHLTDIKDVSDGKLVSLLGTSKDKLQLLLFYVTVPADATDPRAAIGNVTLAGTP